MDHGSSVGVHMRILIAVGVVVIVLAGGAWWYFADRADPEPEPLAIELIPDAPPADPPEVHYPVPEIDPVEPPADPAEEDPDRVETAEPVEPPAPPLPPLDQSSDAVRDALAGLVDEAKLDDWLLPEDVIRRIVATVDSLDGEHIQLRHRPARHIEGTPEVEVVDPDEDRYVWLAENEARYRPVVRILLSVRPREAAELYFRLYPLFQAAYEEISRPGAYFNDRLVEIIDHLLDGPDPAQHYELKRPEVLYEFADPELEEESWGRKIMLRMGPENANAVEGWLRSFRAEIMQAT